MRAPVQEAEAQREKARRRREALIEEVAAWRRAGEIRAYVKTAKAEMEQSGEETSAAFIEWEQWAKRVVAEMDPVGVRVQASGAGDCRKYRSCEL